MKKIATVKRINASALALSVGILIAPLSCSAASESAPSTEYPSDVNSQSGFRLPLPAREDLDDLARKSYDRANTPGGNIAGLRGPAGVRLYSPVTAYHHAAISEYLRKKSGIPPIAREIAILTTARELDSQFEWAEHEPVALKEGVSPQIIDIIKYRRSTSKLRPEDALLIELGRQMWAIHKVEPDVFVQLKEIYGPQKLIDIILLMGYYGGTAALLSAVDMQLQPGKGEPLPVPKSRIGGWYPVFFDSENQVALDEIIEKSVKGQIKKLVIGFDENTALANNIASQLRVGCNCVLEMRRSSNQDTDSVKFDHQRVTVLVYIE